jgi:hypothetical protein
MVRAMVAQAFHALTGKELADLKINLSITTPKILNTDASHSGQTVTGENLHAKIYSANDYVYPFATFTTDHTNAFPLEGEIVQTSPGHGEFVYIMALQRSKEGLFDLGEKFLGQGTWERSVLDQVGSMDDEQRGEVYKRIFKH